MSLFVDDKDVDSRKGGTVLCKGPQVHVSISVLNRVVLLLRRVFLPRGCGDGSIYCWELDHVSSHVLGPGRPSVKRCMSFGWLGMMNRAVARRIKCGAH
jgi:hypothetical protein